MCCFALENNRDPKKRAFGVSNGGTDIVLLPTALAIHDTHAPHDWYARGIYNGDRARSGLMLTMHERPRTVGRILSPESTGSVRPSVVRV